MVVRTDYYQDHRVVTFGVLEMKNGSLAACLELKMFYVDYLRSTVISIILIIFSNKL